MSPEEVGNVHVARAEPNAPTRGAFGIWLSSKAKEMGY